MKFSEIKYVRPDMDKLKAEAESAADRIKTPQMPMRLQTLILTGIRQRLPLPP